MTKDFAVACDVASKKELYRCHWTSKLVNADDVVWSAPIMSWVKHRYAAKPGYESIRNESLKLFQNFERNCNTCRHLERVKHPRNPMGFLKGICKITNRNLAFHPDDPMLMSCYEERK